jgi:malonyl-CoA decarboxylase
VSFLQIMKYEAVHAITDWDSMKQRLGPRRLCYAFFHRSLPLEPLAFVQVSHISDSPFNLVTSQIAITSDIEMNVQTLLNDRNPSADLSNLKTAVFYSISSTQRGLSGVDLGNLYVYHVVYIIYVLTIDPCNSSLIKRVVREIQKLYPLMETFSTLSPIPGFRKWLTMQVKLNQKSLQNLLLQDEIESLRTLAIDLRYSGEAGSFLEV